jgi:hypothetical protein
MKSITIHNMNDLMAEKIRLRAAEEGQSINKTIKQLLTDALGIQDTDSDFSSRSGYSRFCGLWSEKEAREFNTATADFETIDENEWT